MNKKLYELKIKKYEKIIQSKLSYLYIDRIISPKDEDYDSLFSTFHSINKIVLKSYSFYIYDKIDNNLFNSQKNFALNEFKLCVTEMLLDANTSKHIYLTYSCDSISFWLKIEKQSILDNLALFFKDFKEEFFFLTENSYTIQLYRGEYCWEILSNAPYTVETKINRIC